MGRPSHEPASGWILYDGQCGVCRRLSERWAGTLQRRGFGLSPLQSEWVKERLGLSADELLSDLRLLLPDGTHRQGADVYRHVMRRIPWTYPLYLLSRVPLIRHLFDWAYRTFATHRHIISDACKLPGGEAP